MDTRLKLARTTAFIAVVYAENVRAYTSRSFDEPVWVEMCKNTAMQKAILMAQVALYAVIFLPGLSDTIFELEGLKMSQYVDQEGMGGVGWAFAVGAAVGCTVSVSCFSFYIFTFHLSSTSCCRWPRWKQMWRTLTVGSTTYLRY